MAIGFPTIEICDTTTGNQLNPADPFSILNPNFTPDTGNLPGISILIFINTTSYQFNQYYHNASLVIEENRGFERGSAKFTIVDSDPSKFNLPFVPLIDMRIEIWNRSENDLLFTGRIAEVEATMFGNRRCDGTEVLQFDINCTDLKVDFERVLVAERYQNVTTGFIARDVIRRFTFFDESEIDPTQGGVVTDLRFNNEYVASVLQTILQLEPTWTFWFDYTNNKVYIGETSNTQNTILNVTESNVYNYFGAYKPIPFALTPDNSVVRNRVYFWYNSKYAEGTVSITEGDVIVSGQNTLWLSYVLEGASIRFNGEPAEYSIQQVLSDTELRISSPWQSVIPNYTPSPVILTTVPYEIIGSETVAIVEDPVSIAYMAQMNNEVGHNAGVYEYKVPNDGTPYTREQAFQIANSHLLRFIDPAISGKASSDNDRLPFRNLHAGQVIAFNLPTSRKVIADVVIQQLTKKDTGALLPRVDTDPGEDRIDPFLEYSFDFKDRIFDIRNQIKRLGIDIRRTTFGDNTIIQDALSFGEAIYVSACFHLYAEPITINEPLKVDDSVLMHFPPSPGIYYTQPTAQRAGYTIGASQWGFTS